MIDNITNILASSDSPLFVVTTLSLVVVGLALYLAIILAKKGD